MTTKDAHANTRTVVTDPNLALRIGRASQDTGTVLWRDMIRTTRQPEMLVFAIVMGVFFLLLFNYVFGGAIGAGAGFDYLQYLLPGVLVITALQGAQQTSMGLAADFSEGVNDRFRSLPMSRSAVITGRTIADALRNIAGMVLVALVGTLMGFRFASFGGAVVAIALATGIGYGFSWLGAAIAAKVRQPEMVGMLSMFWLFPLMLASTAFAPVETMPGWLQPFVTYQPISVASDAVRGLANGVPVGDRIALTLAWIAVLLVVFVPMSVRLYRKVS
ncbi:MAG: ABC transporter permease [Acidimicrobiia bacterium]|nr:MAG: ABC transporter permease [Acidimicrobiia bacterium]